MSIEYDIIIRNATLVDGTGEAAYEADIAISGENIAAIGRVSGSAPVQIDASGLFVCPGFIDAHSHADLSILSNPGADNLILQGITSFVGGHCGIANAPVKDGSYVNQIAGCFDIEPSWKSFNDFLNIIENCGIAVNYIPLAGHHALRGEVLGKNYNRKSTREEIDEIKKYLKEALESGCYGMSVGLDGGTPGHFADIEELVELVKMVKEHGGVFAPHTRHHQNQWPAETPGENAYGIFDAPPGEIIAGRYHGLLEAIEITRMAGNPRLHISHLTSAYIVPQPHPEWLDEALAKATLEDIVDKAATEGIDVSYNVIPSEHSVGRERLVVSAFFNPVCNLPEWLTQLSRDEFIVKLKTKDFREKVKNLVYSGKMKFHMIHPLTDPYWMECYTIQRCGNEAYRGRTVWEIARSRQADYTIDAVYNEALNVLFDIICEDPDTTWALSKDKREAGSMHVLLQHPLGIPCTDFYAKTSVDMKDSPSDYNLFPMFLHKMVKERQLLTFEEAIRKISSLPAEIFGINDRGVLKAGNYADIVIMDFPNLQVHDDFLNPVKITEEIKYVIVNGQIASTNGTLKAEKNGKVLRKSVKEKC